MIHQYQNNGYNIVLDVNSGCVHVVDQMGYDVIAALNAIHPEQTASTIQTAKTREAIKAQFENTYEPEEIDTVLDDLAELTEAGQLFAPDTHEACIQDVMKRKTVVKALCLHIAHDCNLACKYCFAEEGEYHGRRALMSFEVGKKALDFLINSGSRRNLEVDFFGGEPLMNWQVVKDLVAYGRESRRRFTTSISDLLLPQTACF